MVAPLKDLEDHSMILLGIRARYALLYGQKGLPIRQAKRSVSVEGAAFHPHF